LSNIGAKVERTWNYLIIKGLLKIGEKIELQSGKNIAITMPKMSL